MEYTDLKSKILQIKIAGLKWFAKSYALFRNRLHWAQYRIAVWGFKYRTAITISFLFLLVSVSVCFLPVIQSFVEPYFSGQNKISDLRSLLQGIGAALIGATAIAFSLVMFAMQVNVERMPHGLFFKFSSDRRILAYFGGTFLLAIAIACSSLVIDDASHVGIALLAGFWAIAAILIFVFSAFRRALFLINPIKQLEIVIRDAQKELRISGRRADVAKPLFEDSQGSEQQGDALASTEHDLPRIAYFQLNPHWTQGAKRAIDHCISFAHRYAEQGDYQVSGEALRAVAEINACYVEAKGKTFFTNVLFFSNPLTTDGFLNKTLEHLRQTVRIALKRGDERQVEQALGAFTKLVWVYVNIDYGGPYASKTHAHLAASYLSDAVQSVVPHNMPDVLMDGVRLLGQSALLFLAKGKPDEIASLVEKIALVSCTGVANEQFRPVTLAGVEEIAKLTVNLLQAKSYDIRFAAKELQRNMSLVTNLFLQVPDAPLSSIHSTYLGPYYSSASTTSLLSWLRDLANQALQAEADNENAQTVIRNIETWADGLYESQKKLLLLAVEKRSHFSFDVIHWITHVTKLLLAISEAPSCDEHTKDEIQKHARWLLFTLSSIPDDKETIAFVETFRMTENLFEVAMYAQQRGCLEFSTDTTRELLLGWAFKAGKYQTGRGILERALYALATLALVNDPHDEQVEYLKQKLTEYLGSPHAPEQDIRDRAARQIRERAATLYREGHWWSSQIEHAMSQLDEAVLRPLLEDIANTLSPGTANESIRFPHF